MNTSYLAGSLIQPQMMPQLLLTDGPRRINLVAKDEERNLRQLLDGEKSIKLSLGLGKTLKVGTINQEDDTVDLREVVPPETAS